MLSVEIARREALFCADLSASGRPARHELDEAIRAAVRSHGGVRGCAADVAQQYGDHPDIAVPRMRWASSVVADAYPKRSLR